MNKTKPLTEYNEGDIFEGEKITTLYSVKSDYIIFENNNSGEITVKTESEKLRRNCSEISDKISLITEYLTTTREKKKFVDYIGLAYSEAIEGNIEKADKICDKLIERIESYKSNIGRFYYLLSCFVVVIIVMLIAYFLKKFQFIPEIIPHFYFMAYASIGGFLSVAKDIKQINIESTEFGWFQIIYGALRIIIAMFSGLIIYLLIKSELILSNLNNNNDFFVIAIFSVIAGFSETFIPNLLKKVKTESNNEK